MTTGDDSPLFVDTNTIVYAALAEAPLHQVARDRLQELFAAGVELWISRQMMREYLATVTRPQSFLAIVDVPLAIADVRFFSELFQIAEDGPAVTENLLRLLDEVTVGGRQIHDANIVATMQAHGIRRLLTHNVADFTRFAPHITVVPLVAEPGG